MSRSSNRNYGTTTTPKEPAVFYKLNSSAEDPVLDESGTSYDISLLERIDVDGTSSRSEDICNNINLFRTGINIKTPVGFHVELVATSDLFNMGYAILGTVIYDGKDGNEFIVPLYKFKDCEDLSLPCKGIRLIFRETITVNFSKGTGNPKGEIANSSQANGMTSAMMQQFMLMQQMMAGQNQQQPVQVVQQIRGVRRNKFA